MLVSLFPSSSKSRSLRFVPPIFRDGGDCERDLLVARDLLAELQFDLVETIESVGDISPVLPGTIRVLDWVLIGGGLTAGRIGCFLGGGAPLAARGSPAMIIACTQVYPLNKVL